jgi:hypothetical protein
MNEYEVLSAIYKILGDTSINTLERILRSSSEPAELLAVVQALKAARDVFDVKYDPTHELRLIQREKALSELDSGPRKDVWSDNSRKLWNTFRQQITDKRRLGITNQTVIEVFARSGVKVPARKKEGINKIVLVIEDTLNNIEDSKRVKVLDQVLRLLGLSQTKGYMEALKSRNNNQH